MTGWKYPVLFFIHGIGDSFINLPALRALSRWADGRLTIITARSPAARIFDELPARIVAVKEEGRRFDWRAAAEAVGQCDLFLTLVPILSYRNLVAELMKALKPTLSIGYDHGTTEDVSLTFDVNLVDNRATHSAHLAFNVVHFLWPDARFEDFADPPPVTDRVRSLTRDLKRQLPCGTKWLAVHTHSSPPKMWGPERFSKVLTHFLHAHPEYICLLIDVVENGVCGDADVQHRIVPVLSGTRLPSHRHREASYLTLGIGQCIVQESDLFLGIDSCFLHVADLGRVPTVALFGPTYASDWGCLLTSHRTLQGRGRMSDIKVEDVLEALESLASCRC